MWEAFLVCTGVVALGEMGDKAILWVSIRWVHVAAALVFTGLGVAVLAGVSSSRTAAPAQHRTGPHSAQEIPPEVLIRTNN